MSTPPEHATYDHTTHPHTTYDHNIHPTSAYDHTIHPTLKEPASTSTLTHSATNISISPELFEKLYLNPKTTHSQPPFGANATPIGFLGFVLAAYTFSMIAMGWGGASGFAAVAGIFFFTGPLLMVLSLIFLWIQGQFFPMMVCGLFSAFWLSLGMLQLPTLGLAAFYAPIAGNENATPAMLAAQGAASKEYNAAIGLYLLVWVFGLFTFFIFTLRINVVMAGIFGFTTTSVGILSGAYFKLSLGELTAAARMFKVSQYVELA